MADFTDTDVLRSALAEARHIAETVNAQRNSLVAFVVALLQRQGGEPVVFDLLALEAAAKRRIVSGIDRDAQTLTLSLAPVEAPAEAPRLTLVP